MFLLDKNCFKKYSLQKKNPNRNAILINIKKKKKKKKEKEKKKQEKCEKKTDFLHAI